MNKKFLEKQIRRLEERRAALKKKGTASEDIAEVRGISEQVEEIDGQIAEFRAQLDEIIAEETRVAEEAAAAEAAAATTADPGANVALETRAAGGQLPATGLNALETFAQGVNGDLETRAKAKEEAEKRGQDLKLENRSVTVTSSNLVVPAHASDKINEGFNEVSTLLDRVTTENLPGGESYTEAYISGYGTADHSTEEAEYNTAEPTFNYAAINKSKVTAYGITSEEALKLPAADYDGKVQEGVRIAERKKITREILVGTGATNRLAGIFSSAAAAIDAATDLEVAAIDNETLDEIIFSYGGDEDVEDAAVLILNKNDLKAFAKLRNTDGGKFHTIVSNGNTGTIDGIPFLINSACYAISNGATEGQYCMAYGSLSNYKIALFSEMEIKRSTEYLFKTGQVAHRASVFVGGNVVVKNGFLRVKYAVAGLS